MNPDVQTALAEKFSPKEIGQIEGFLNRGFSPNGEIVIGSIFLYANKHQKSVQEVLRECEKEWERNWKNQHPELRADPDAPGGAGQQNRTSLYNIYEALGVPNPLKEGRGNIPKGAFKVATMNSVYQFGEVGENGERKVSRDKKPLWPNRCRILFLSVGKSMTFETFVDHNYHSTVTTSPVYSIEE